MSTCAPDHVPGGGGKPPGGPPPHSYFGDYFLIGALGRGGMGEVWLARQESLNRRVALKWIQADHPDPIRRQRFQLEAEAAARLRHENIVQVFEVGETDGRQFIAMEYLEGGSLAETLDGPDWRPTTGARRERQEAIARLVATVARAVHYAHQHGVIHRDLKPGNILLDAEGVPHVADFGLAKLVHNDEALSLTGHPMGSAGYVSPEQASGQHRGLTTATDVFSLGAILYHALTGAVPFAGATWLEALRAVQEREPAKPSALNPAVDRDLETICLKCLEKDPGRRYGSAEALAEELDRWTRQEPIRARPVTTFERVTKWARRRPAFASLLAAVTLLALVVFIGLPIALVNINAARTEADRSNVAMRQTLANSHLERGMNSVGPDRSVENVPWLAAAHAMANGNERDERINRLRLASALEDCHRLIQVIASDTAPIRGAALSPDGRWIATVELGQNARVWDARTGRPVTPVLQGTPVPESSSSKAPVYVQFHPTQALLLASTGGDAPGLWDLSNPSAPRGLNFRDKHTDVVRTAQFSKDGGRILSLSDDRSATVWSTATRKPLFPIRTFSAPETPFVNASISPNDDTFCVTTTYRVELFQPETGKSKQRVAEVLPFVQAVYHPDGRHLSTITQDGGWQTWDLARNTMRRNVPVSSPQFLAVSPSGDHVAVASGQQCHLGTSELNRHLDHEGYVDGVTFSPCGSLVATSSADQKVRLWSVRDGMPIGQPLMHLSRVIELNFDADGTRILTASEDGLVRLWQVRLPGAMTKPTVHALDRITHAAFDPTGERFVVATRWGHFQVHETRSGRLLGQRRETSPSTNQSQFMTNPSRYAGFAPDGRRVVVTDARSHFTAYDLASQQVVTQFQAFSMTRKFARLFGPEFVKDFINGWPTVQQLWRHMLEMRTRDLEQQAPTPDLNVAVYSPDGGLVLTASDDGSAHLFDSTTWAYVGEGNVEGVGNIALQMLGHHAAGRWLGQHGEFGHSNAVVHAAFNHRGDRIVTASFDSSAQIWNTTNRQRATPPLLHAAPVLFAAFHPDDSIVATASQDGTVKLWESMTGRELPVGSLCHDGSVTRVIFNRDGSRIASGSDDGTARVWETATGRLKATAPVGSRVIALGFAANGELLFTAGGDHHARLWDASTGLPVSPPIGRRVTHAAYSPESRHCLLVEANMVARIQSLEAYASRLPDASLLVTKARLYPGRQLEPTGRGLSTIPPAEFRQIWAEASSRWPNEFSASKEDIAAWHRFWQKKSEEAGDTFAAGFHTERLKAE